MYVKRETLIHLKSTPTVRIVYVIFIITSPRRGAATSGVMQLQERHRKDIIVRYSEYEYNIIPVIITSPRGRCAYSID